MQHTTHPKVVAGVVLIASLLLFSTVFAVVMGISWAAAPPETRVIGTVRIEPTLADWFSLDRVIWSAIAGALVTWGFWAIAGR